MGDDFLCAGDSGRGGFAVVGGVCGGVVHADFADEGALAERQKLWWRGVWWRGTWRVA